MANFSSSDLLAGQAKFNQRVLEGGEWRSPDTVAMLASTRGDMANPMLASLKTREDRSVTAKFPIRQATTSKTARAHNHTGSRGDSLSETISWSTIAETFSISIKQGDNNLYSFDEMFASTMQNAKLNLLDRIDAAFVTSLVADKTGYNAGGGNGSFNGTADVYEIPVAESDFFYQNAKATMEFNLYRSGNLLGVVDDRAYVNAQRLMAQGAGNATNTSFQFAGMTILPSTRTLLSGYGGSGLFFQAGLVAFIPWIPVQNRKNIDFDQALQYNGDYGQIFLPELGANVALHMYAERADGTAANGYTQDLVIQGELSVDMGYVSAPLSTFRGADDSPVYAIGQAV